MDLFFGAVWFFFGEAILSYCETKRAAMCRKTNPSDALGSTLLSLTVNLYYYGKKGSARRFAEEMEKSGTADAIRNEKGCLRYEYFFPMNDNECVLLINSWENQEAIDLHHHASKMMQSIASLREKYDLHMRIERYISDETIPERDKSLIRK